MRILALCVDEHISDAERVNKKAGDGVQRKVNCRCTAAGRPNTNKGVIAVNNTASCALQHGRDKGYQIPQFGNQ